MKKYINSCLKQYVRLLLALQYTCNIQLCCGQEQDARMLLLFVFILFNSIHCPVFLFSQHVHMKITNQGQALSNE